MTRFGVGSKLLVYDEDDSNSDLEITMVVVASTTTHWLCAKDNCNGFHDGIVMNLEKDFVTRTFLEHGVVLSPE